MIGKGHASFIAACLLNLGAEGFSQDHPKFFITSRRTAAWAQMKADYDANPSNPATLGGRLYKFAVQHSPGPVGLTAAWLYRVTGDARYATAAYNEITGLGDMPMPNRCTNFLRHHSWMMVTVYDWIYPALNAAQRTDFQTDMNDTLIQCETLRPFRGGDSDETTGEYFGAAMWYLSTNSHNPTATTIWNNPDAKYGGLTATAPDWTTHRNSVKYYLDRAAGGEWIESTQYNLNTIVYALMGAEAIKTWTGIDYFPEITAWRPDGARAFMQGMVSDLSMPYQWGDNENPRNPQWYYRWRLGAVFAGLLIADGTVGPQIQDWVHDTEAILGLSTIAPDVGMFPVYDPYATRGDRTTVPRTHFGYGVGVLHSRTGWADTEPAFFAHFATLHGADHQTMVWGEMQFWWNHQWVFTHPVCYYCPSSDQRASNGLSIGGLDVEWAWMHRQYRKLQAYEENASSGHVYATGTQGGLVYDTHWYQGPDNFLHEDTRSIVYLPGLDAFVVHDRTNAVDPESVNFFTSYHDPVENWIMYSTPPRKQLFVHLPTGTPTLGSNYTEWSLTGGSARVSHLLPIGFSRIVQNETTVWNDPNFLHSGYFDARELKYRIRISPSSDQQWDTFLNVWQAYRGSPATTTLVQDTTNKVDAALVLKGSTQYLVAFNALQGPNIPGCTYARPETGPFCEWTPGVDALLDAVRIRNDAYTLTFTSPGSSTKLIALDLSTARSWEYTVNGGGAIPLNASPKGVGTATIIATGSVTLVVRPTSARR